MLPSKQSVCVFLEELHDDLFELIVVDRSHRARAVRLAVHDLARRFVDLADISFYRITIGGPHQFRHAPERRMIELRHVRAHAGRPLP